MSLVPMVNIAPINGHRKIVNAIDKHSLIRANSPSSSAETASKVEERVERKDIFIEHYESVLSLLESPVQPLSWTQLILELRSGLTVDADADEREKLEDAMMQKVMVTNLDSVSRNTLQNDVPLLQPPNVSREDAIDEVVDVDDGDTNAATVDSVIRNIELTKQTLDWWNRAQGQYNDMFSCRMQSLMTGRRIYTLAKRLHGSDLPIFETKLYGHRILWSLVERNAASSLLA